MVAFDLPELPIVRNEAFRILGDEDHVPRLGRDVDRPGKRVPCRMRRDGVDVGRECADGCHRLVGRGHAVIVRVDEVHIPQTFQQLIGGGGQLVEPVGVQYGLGDEFDLVGAQAASGDLRNLPPAKAWRLGILEAE